MEDELRIKAPLVVCISNQVTMNEMANVLTSIGASPIMTNDIRECTDLLNLCKIYGGSLLINIGTINQSQEELIYKAVEIANAIGIKVILDPVGAGASKLRTQICLNLLEKYKINILKGNQSEINAILYATKSKGVDGTNALDLSIAKECAQKYNLVCLMTGEIDSLATPYIYKGIKGGNKMLKNVSGTGCILGAIIAAYAAITDEVNACEFGLERMLKASERIKVNSIAKFHLALLDNLAGNNEF